MIVQTLSPSQNRIRYLAPLDGLRGVAILAVLAFHGEFPYLRGGYIGVDIFFLLSGFLITATLIREFDQHGQINLRNFYMRRILRLLPALVALLLIYIAYCIVVFDGNTLRMNLAAVVPVLFYFVNWLRAFHIMNPIYLAHTWSLSIEEQFYIVWPIVFSYLMRRIAWRPTLFFITVGLSFASLLLRVILIQNGISVDRLYNGSDTRADILLLGCSLAIIISTGTLIFKIRASPLYSRLLGVISFISVLAFPVLMIFSKWTDPNMYRYGFFAVGLGSAILVLQTIVFEQSLLSRILALSPLVWIGKISYGLYLWHYPVFKVMRDYGASRMTVMTLGVLITFAIAAISYYVLERQFLRLKNRYA